MADRNTAFMALEMTGYHVKGSTSIDAGKMVALDSTGYAVPAADTAGHIVVGVADEAVDNSSGSNGDETVRVRRGKAFLLDNDTTNTIVQADIGKTVYVTDAETVDNDGGTNAIVAGRCLGIETAGVWVEIGGPSDRVSAVVGRYVAIADPGASGAIPVTEVGVCAVTTAAAETRTLADPAHIGDIVTITLDVDGGNCVITAASGINNTGNNTITMADAGDTLSLIATQVAGDLVWRVLANDGAVLSTVA